MKASPEHLRIGLLIEKDPHQLIEGMILASYAIGATSGVHLLLAENSLKAIANLTRTVAEASNERIIWAKNIWS